MSSSEYKEYLKSDHWQLLRLKKLKRTSMCFCCRSDRRLEVHHLRYKDLYDVTLNDLKVLCYDCHRLYHAFKNKRFGFMLSPDDLLKKVKRKNRKRARLKQRGKWFPTSRGFV